MTRDPAEAVIPWLSLSVTAVLAVLLVAYAATHPAVLGGLSSLSKDVVLSVISAPSPAPRQPAPKIEKHITPVVHTPVKYIVRADPSPTSAPIPLPLSAPPQSDATPAFTMSAPGPYDPNAAYIVRLAAITQSQTSPPDTYEYHLHHPSGEVFVQFTLTRAGNASDIGVVRSSGSEMLDRRAVEIVASCAYPPMPPNVYPGESRHVFRVDVGFEQSRYQTD